MSNLDRTPRLTPCGEDAPETVPVVEQIPGRVVPLGETSTVRRLLPTRRRSTVGAWCFVDLMGPDTVEAGAGMRVPPHPHIGLQTVTWLVAGEVLHRDSLGSEQLVRPGQLNLMTAGRGIAHSEESPRNASGLLHGVQLWTALPNGTADVEPAFEHHPGLPQLRRDGASVTVLVGEMAGATSPATTFSPLVGADVAVAGKGRLPLRPDFEHAVLVVDGEVTVGDREGVVQRPGSLLYLGEGRTSLLLTAPAPSRLLLIGGEPFGESIVMWWNFVAHSADEIQEARADWEAGRRFGTVHGYDGEPLPAPPLPAGRLRPRR